MRKPIHVARSLIAVTFLLTACDQSVPHRPDKPRLTVDVRMEDVTFRSRSLNRDIKYRVILPGTISAGARLPVVYLLHGSGGDYREWSNDSDVAGFARNGLILVMPEGESSYYTNAAEHPNDRFEDYIVTDLISEAESRYPADPSRRGIAGVSMGGFGAIKIALKHPGL